MNRFFRFVPPVFLLSHFKYPHNYQSTRKRSVRVCETDRWQDGFPAKNRIGNEGKGNRACGPVVCVCMKVKT